MYRVRTGWRRVGGEVDVPGRVVPTEHGLLIDYLKMRLHTQKEGTTCSSCAKPATPTFFKLFPRSGTSWCCWRRHQDGLELGCDRKRLEPTPASAGGRSIWCEAHAGAVRKKKKKKKKKNSHCRAQEPTGHTSVGRVLRRRTLWPLRSHCCDRPQDGTDKRRAGPGERHPHPGRRTKR